jgi:hypothetical protein
VIALSCEPSIQSIAEAYFAIRIVFIVAVLVLVLCLLAVATGKCLERINREFEDAENKEGE